MDFGSGPRLADLDPPPAFVYLFSKHLLSTITYQAMCSEVSDPYVSLTGKSFPSGS